MVNAAAIGYDVVRYLVSIYLREVKWSTYKDAGVVNHNGDW